MLKVWGERAIFNTSAAGRFFIAQVRASTVGNYNELWRPEWRNGVYYHNTPWPSQNIHGHVRLLAPGDYWGDMYELGVLTGSGTSYPAPAGTPYIAGYGAQRVKVLTWDGSLDWAWRVWGPLPPVGTMVVVRRVHNPAVWSSPGYIQQLIGLYGPGYTTSALSGAFLHGAMREVITPPDVAVATLAQVVPHPAIYVLEFRVQQEGLSGWRCAIRTAHGLGITTYWRNWAEGTPQTTDSNPNNWDVLPPTLDVTLYFTTAIYSV
ncbi:MAG: hypothetical protein QXZ09_07535, partial [Candidatus Methanomethylicaceae archaeon]